MNTMIGRIAKIAFCEMVEAVVDLKSLSLSSKLEHHRQRTVILLEVTSESNFSLSD